MAADADDKAACTAFLKHIEDLIAAKYDYLTDMCVENDIALDDARKRFMDLMLEQY